MANNAVIITDCDHYDIEIETEILSKSAIKFQKKQCKTEQDLIEQCRDATVWINQYAPITENVLANSPNLKLVIRYGVGVNNVDVQAATKYDVQVCNVPDYGTQEVADHALACLLTLTRKVSQMSSLVKQGVWDYQKSIPVYRHSEQKVGIIGIGRIGTAFANRVHALNSQVLAYDPKMTEERINRAPEFVQFVDLETLLKESDIVSIHCPLDSAYHLIGEEELQKMKRSSYLINVSRGGIINENALDKALTEGWIAGAALDVSEIEPIPLDSPLLSHENLYCTPHMGWYSEESAKELKRKVAEEAVRFLQGEQVHYPINNIT
ncbi:C-terminal binding protein [Psychrobacillus sp. FSL K6-2365]|uniref:C-terminal binding protein n=1 Tax=Psychrobacillus sp. FSL K6-2365 TaxID=2921546 RepID=UPI0030F9029E